MCVTSAGFIVHWDRLDSDTAWEHMCADLDIPNFTMLYTSKIVKKKAFEEEADKRTLLDQIIDDIGTQYEETEIGFWDLMVISINRHYDIMLGF